MSALMLRVVTVAPVVAAGEGVRTVQQREQLWGKLHRHPHPAVLSCGHSLATILTMVPGTVTVEPAGTLTAEPPDTV